MGDYLIWAAEKLEHKYGWDFDNACEYLMSGAYIPEDVSIERYIKEEKECQENKQLEN